MGDNLGCGGNPHAPGHRQIAARGHAIQEPGRKLIARPRGIHRRDARHRHLYPFGPAQNFHRLAGMGAHHDVTNRRRPAQGRIQIIGLIQRQPFFVIADHEIHLGFDQGQEIGPVAVDAKRIGQRDTDLAPPRAAMLGGGGKGGFAFGLVVQIPL